MDADNSSYLSHQNVKANRARSALQMLFIGDALSMPVHWYYRPADIWRAFPTAGVRELVAAPASHPSSIMSLHSTSGGGRSNRQLMPAQQIVGEVILKGKAEYWNKSNVHYHHGLGAGENTLNTWCAHLLIKWITERASGDPETIYDVNEWLNHYVEFMTADPPRHPDTYAESYHRGFFANYVTGIPVNRCGASTHDTPSMGALVTVAPLALALLNKLPLDVVQAVCRQHVWSTHPDEMLLKVVDAYVKLMSLLLSRKEENKESVLRWICDAASVVKGGNISALLLHKTNSAPAEDIMRYLSEDMSVVGGRYSLACYITDSWPSVCYLAARHYSDPKRALLINTNLGGENAHRGSVLGTLLGLLSGQPVIDFYNGLARHKEIDADINHWVCGFYN